jgi:hypothetical protein
MGRGTGDKAQEKRTALAVLSGKIRIQRVLLPDGKHQKQAEITATGFPPAGSWSTENIGIKRRKGKRLREKNFALSSEWC